MEPDYEGQMRVSEQRPRRGRELLMTGFLKAQIEPEALVLGLSRAHHPLDVLLATGGAAHNAVRPAHLLDVLKTLLFGAKLYRNVRDTYGLRMDSLVHVFILHKQIICVK